MQRFKNLKKLTPRNLKINAFCRLYAAKEARQKASWVKREMLDNLRYETLAHELEMPNFASINNAPKAIYVWDVFNPKMFLPRLSINLGFILAIAFGLIVIPGKASAASLAGAGQLITAPNSKLIEFNVSTDYQPKTNITLEKKEIDNLTNICYHHFNKDKLTLSGEFSINLPWGISFGLEDQNEKQKGTIIQKREGRSDMNISYESSKNIILITEKKKFNKVRF